MQKAHLLTVPALFARIEMVVGGVCNASGTHCYASPVAGILTFFSHFTGSRCGLVHTLHLHGFETLVSQSTLVIKVANVHTRLKCDFIFSHTCMLTPFYLQDLSAPSNEETDELEEWEDEEDDSAGVLNATPPRPGSLDKNGCPIMVIVDRSGIHYIGVRGCKCEDSKPLDQQMLDMAIYPGSQKRPQTGFSFTVLDDFLVDNRECKVSALRFYTKLRRITSNAFPSSAPASCQYMVYASPPLMSM